MSKYKTDIISTATDINKKNIFSKDERSIELKKVKSTRIVCNSNILFRNRDNKIFDPTTKFKILLSVELYPIT
jgi:hypothetical protein